MRRLLVCAALLVAACTTVPANDSAPTRDQECQNEGLDAFVGREATSDLGSAVLAKSGAKVLRWLQPGQAVTMEFRFDRVNILIAANNRVERVNCG